jgi:hypothetical protein
MQTSLQRYNDHKLLDHLVPVQVIKPCLICESSSQRAVKTFDAHTFAKQTETNFKQTSVRKLMATVLGTRRECLRWNSCNKGHNNVRLYCEY